MAGSVTPDQGTLGWYLLVKEAKVDQVLTLDQIKEEFDSEWILLADPEVDRRGQIVRGRVVAHSKDRDEVYRKSIELRLKSAATLYTGKMPKDTAIVL